MFERCHLPVGRLVSFTTGYDYHTQHILPNWCICTQPK